MQITLNPGSICSGQHHLKSSEFHLLQKIELLNFGNYHHFLQHWGEISKAKAQKECL